MNSENSEFLVVQRIPVFVILKEITKKRDKLKFFMNTTSTFSSLENNHDLESEEIRKRLNDIFDPLRLKKELLVRSMFLCVFEVLKKCVTEPGEKFFLLNGDYEEIINAFYPRNKKNKIIKDKFFAWSKWLVSMNAIDDIEFDLLMSLKNKRNDVAHKLANILFDLDHEFEFESVDIIVSLNILSKIESWWIEIETGHPANEVYGSRQMFLSKLIEAVFQIDPSLEK